MSTTRRVTGGGDVACVVCAWYLKFVARVLFTSFASGCMMFKSIRLYQVVPYCYANSITTWYHHHHLVPPPPPPFPFVFDDCDVVMILDKGCQRLSVVKNFKLSLLFSWYLLIVSASQNNPNHDQMNQE